MEDQTNNAGAPAPVAGMSAAPIGSVPVPPIPATAPAPAMARQIVDPSPEDIGAELSKTEAAAPVDPHAPVAHQPPEFDISSLRPEQLQQLKAMLTSTPERAAVKQSNPVVTLRRFVTVSQEGEEKSRIITGFRNAYNTWVKDEQLNANVEQVMIPVHFLDDAEGKYVNVNYKDFINSQQIRCEVIATRNKEGRIVEGEVLQRSTGRIIEREIKTLQTWFTVKLPEGTTPSTVEIEAAIANG